MTAIQVNHLSFAYDTTYVLKEISFQIEKGEFIALIGPNGGGKTTLLSLLMGFLRPLDGSIEIFGLSPEKARSLIGWVPQSFGFDRKFPISVLEVVLMGRLKTKRFWGWYNQTDHQIAKSALEQVRMLPFYNVPFFALSRGQAQRVLVARALAGDHPILLLDEPTASIDKESQNELYSLLKSLKGKKTILMVTHDYQRAMEDVDRVLCVQRDLTILEKDALCKHYAIGLYHPPLHLSKERG